MSAPELPHANAREGLIYREGIRLDSDILARLAEALPDTPEIRAAINAADDELTAERDALYTREWVADAIGAAARESAENLAEAVRDALAASADRSRLFATPAETVEHFDDSSPWGVWVDEATASATDSAI